MCQTEAGKIFSIEDSLVGNDNTHDISDVADEIQYAENSGSAILYDDNKSMPILKNAKQYEPEKEKDSPGMCDDCGISFKSQGTMERHQKKFKCGERAIYLLETSANLVKTRICKLCGFSTNNEESLKIHNCELFPKINCEKCPYSTRLVTKLDLHKSLEHMVPLKCNQCDYQKQHNLKDPMAAKKSMYKHIAMHNVGLYECFECGETFKVKQKLTYHITSKHLQYKCQECNKEEASAYKLNQHIKKLHTHVKITCTLCGFLAPSKHLLQKHNNRAHFQSASFVCTSCAYRAESKYLLKKHLKEKHKTV